MITVISLGYVLPVVRIGDSMQSPDKQFIYRVNDIKDSCFIIEIRSVKK